MKLYTLKRTQRLPLSLDDAWRFFSNPANLQEITPEWLDFEITSPAESTTYPGQIITYRIGPLPGIRQSWVTEITTVDAPRFFVDEQRFGPYKFWHHKHYFHEIDGGVVMIDLIHYGLSFGPVGRLVHRLFVQPRLEKIFDFRYQALKKRFGELNGEPRETPLTPSPVEISDRSG